MKKVGGAFKHLILISAVLGLAFLSATSCAKVSAKSTTEQRIDDIMASMTLKEKVAQMLVVDTPSSPYTCAKNHQYGGYTMFAKSFQNSTKDEVKKKIASWQKVSKINMLIAVDEEGGTVVRVSKFPQFRKSPFCSPRYLYNLGGYDKIKSDTASKSKLLKSLGINVNFAPVADVPYKKGDFIYKRAFSTGPKGTSTYIKTVVNEMNNYDMIGTLKHFPGYGNNGDTHTDIIVDKRAKSTFESRDLLPFKAGIKANAPMIMVSHNIVNCFDSKNPASMSKSVHNYLRNDLGFKGVIITDGMSMKAITKKYGSIKSAAVKAVLAGNDMLCTPYGRDSKNAIYDAVKDGTITKSRIDSSVRRILRMKLKYGIIK